MKKFTFFAVIVLLAGITLFSTQASGQTKTLLKTDLSGFEGKEGIVYTATIPVGVTAQKHYHPGYQFSYILEGSIIMNMEGKPPVTYKAGDAFYIPPRQVHFPQNIGTIPVKVISFWLAEKGEPTNIPVK